MIAPSKTQTPIFAFFFPLAKDHPPEFFRQNGSLPVARPESRTASISSAAPDIPKALLKIDEHRVAMCPKP
jgi:hypothetical protein